MFHHTTPEAIESILRSQHFRASPWNIQGTRELINIAFAYFTSLPIIRSEEDLRTIAMASDGAIQLQKTNARSLRDCPVIEVRRDSTLYRTATINVAIPAEIVAPQHVYLKAPVGEPVYYEIPHPRIARVGVRPGRVVPFDGTRLRPIGDELKQFDYVVLGDADSDEGLIAPYDEENTRSIFLIDRCSDTLFDAWRRKANSDQVSGAHFESAQLDRG